MIGIGLPALTALAGCATAVYIRRDTFTNRWESSATINLILQAAGLILIHPYATPLIGAALRATTGSWHIDTWLGHCAYLAAAATILYSVATRLAPPDRVAAAFAPVPHLLTLAATAMFATITMSPHTAAADCPRDIFASPGLKLAEWPGHAGTLIPPADIAIHIEAEDDSARHVTLRAHTPHGSAILQGLDTP